MEYEDKYVQRVIDKYNRRHATAFVRKNAEKRFLSPWGLSLRACPSKDFGRNNNRLLGEEEFQLFTALHFMKYKIKKARTKKCKARYISIYVALRNRGIVANLALISDCIKKYTQNTHNDYSLLMEKGAISLMNSVDGFDPWRGYRFSTYACNAILRNLFSKPKRSYLPLPIEEIEEVLPPPKKADENEVLQVERLCKVIHSDVLTSREKEILGHRFGCFKQEKITLEKLGKQWGLTKEGIRQMQLRTLAKIKKHLSQSPFWIEDIF